jgi:hypothetical protein
MKLLSSRPALWFLFLFNLTIALVVGIGGERLHLHGAQQYMTSIGMAVVALGAGAGLLRRPGATPDAYASSRQPGKPELPYRR